jgi:hypothetical protein
MISLFVSELQLMGGQLPLVDKVTWGGEDHRLVSDLRRGGLNIIRVCTPELWHFYHSKANWYVRGSYMEVVNPWNVALLTARLLCD